MVGEGDTRLVGLTEAFCPESILGLFETEGFFHCGIFIASTHESPGRPQSGLAILRGSLGPNLFTLTGDRGRRKV